MIKAILKFFRNLYDREMDYEFEMDFSIYDIIAGGVLILIIILWITHK